MPKVIESMKDTASSKKFQSIRKKVLNKIMVSFDVGDELLLQED